MLIVLSVLCLLVLSGSAYYLADAKSENGITAAVATLMMAPLFFVVLFQKPKFATGHETDPTYNAVKYVGIVSFAAMAILAALIFKDYEGRSILPMCNDEQTFTLAKGAIADTRLAKEYGVQLIGLTDQSEMNSTKDFRSCQASARLSNGTTLFVTYTLQAVGSSIYIEVIPSG